MQLSNNVFECPIFVSKFSKHHDIKDKLLSLISHTPSETIRNSSDTIYKTDFYKDDCCNYKNFLMPYITEHMKEVFRPLSIPGFKIGNMWFQQYKQNNTHDWHIHGNCHWTNIYFIELKNTQEKTQINNVYNNEQIDYDISEGNILTFPSFLYHKSPNIQSNSKKTIVSFNLNFI